MVIKVLALLLLVLNVLATLTIPSRIGKHREPLTADYIIPCCVLDIVVAAIVGRLWGWW